MEGKRSTNNHYMSYNFAQQCWSLLGLNFDVSRVDVASYWLLERFKEETQEVME